MASAAQMEQALREFQSGNYDASQGKWTNVYSTGHNVRAKANAIRQQMLANSQAWHSAQSKAEQDALHQENLKLNELLNRYAGGVESSYDGRTGQWTTANRNLGYGNVTDFDRENAKRMYGVTDADIDAYLTDTGRYYEFGRERAGQTGYASGAPGAAGAANPAAEAIGAGQAAMGTGGMQANLEAWREAAARQAEARIDAAVSSGVSELERAEEAARRQYQVQRDQTAADEANALDNAALYAELRGDRGGVGLAQYNAIQNTAAENRLAVNEAQTEMAAQTQRQITQLRAQGELEKADKLLEISQSYLKQLISLEQWAAEYNLSAAKFQQTVREWENEFALSASKVTGSYLGEDTLTVREYGRQLLAESGEALLAAGVMPSAEQLEALGLTEAQARALMRK